MADESNMRANRSAVTTIALSLLLLGAPDLFLYAAQQRATVSDRCLVIEDSPLGIEAAIAAGMTAIGFCGGSHCGPEHGDRLLSRGAAVVIADMRELSTAMAKLVR
jgi:beta-phosphoglucomutase-like phosphatase (HAD superfamily)